MPSFFVPDVLRLITTTAFLVIAQIAHAQILTGAGQIIRTDTGGSCSAALIQPDIIVTAAHCTQPGQPSIARFKPGDGQPGTFAITKFARHPLYDPDHPRIPWRFRFDIAVARLAAPVPAERGVPFPVGDDVRAGEDLFVFSWRGGEGIRPRQRKCPVLDGARGLVTLGCRVQGGESGAPVLRQTEDGLELVAVISSRTQILDQPVAQASNLRLRLRPMLDALNSTP